MSATGEFERLLSTLAAAMESVLDENKAAAGTAVAPEVAVKTGGSGGGDAIDAILAAPNRATAVASLRESDVINAFRDELTDGLIRVDTANRLLQLVNAIVTRLLL